MKTKKEIVQSLIDSNQEEIFRLEVVRDFNTSVEVAEAKIQVDAANEQIKKNELQVAWLKEHLKSLE
jgi:outer membrane protein TolC